MVSVKQKQRTTHAVTLNGKELNNVALSRTGVPQLSGGLGYMTIGLNGSVKDRSKRVTV